ncbi:hypothetical protein FAM6410_00640 [Lacticaseibacillus paracasei]|nr:hypothetical protein FAM6410_00640 [Lacticaseibacillus paracasei]
MSCNFFVSAISCSPFYQHACWHENPAALCLKCLLLANQPNHAFCNNPIVTYGGNVMVAVGVNVASFVINTFAV